MGLERIFKISLQVRPGPLQVDYLKTRNSAVADKPRDAFVQMQWRGRPNQRY